MFVAMAYIKNDTNGNIASCTLVAGIKELFLLQSYIQRRQ
jgi:hypothetical protein